MSSRVLRGEGIGSVRLSGGGQRVLGKIGGRIKKSGSGCGGIKEESTWVVFGFPTLHTHTNIQHVVIPLPLDCK